MKLRHIRVFSLNKEAGGYAYNDYRGTAELEDGDETDKSGRRRRCLGSVRLMTREDIRAVPGDYVSLGLAEEPDKGRDFYITAVKDNRRGNLPHWRLLVGRRGLG